jgi:CHAT domain-containing protein
VRLKRLYLLNKNEIPESLNQIATLHIYLEQFEKADSALTMALNIIDDYNLKIDGTYCSILNTYGYLQRNLKKHNEALFYYENALQCLILIDSTNIHGSVSITNNISEIYGYLGNYEKALEYQLSSFNKLKAHSDIFSEEYETCLTNLALNNILGSNYEKALDLVIEAINISKKRIEESFTFLSTEERGNYLEESNSASLFLPSLANKLINSFPTISTFAYNNELFTNAILLNTSRNIQQSILNSKDSSLISTYEDFKNLRRQINYLQQQPVDKQQGLPELEEKANQLDKQLTKASQAYQQNKENLNIQWQDVQNNLKENEAAVQFISFPYYNKRWTDSTMYCALIVKPEMEYPAMIPLFEEKQLQALLEGQANPNTLYASRGTKVSYANTPAKSNGDELYHLIWQPLQSELNEVQTVYFAPSGLLHKVSFSALPVDSTKLLCDQFSLYRLSSTRNVAVQEIYEEEPGTKKIALFGGIDYDLSNQSWSDNELTLTYTESILSRGFSPDSSQRSITFNYLEGTKKEVENIASIVKSNNEFELKYYTADKATEEAFKKLSNQNLNLIHIATHGFFFPPVHQENMRRHELQTLGEQRFRYVPNPLLRSGLLMAGANRTWKGDYPKDSLEDGVLTAQEISEMNLLNTKLVVLSACETGLGDINNSEGVFGLQRAFKLAGVKTLIMSLWKVPDKQTSMLMQAFYTNWLGGMSKHEAFKKAQLSVRKTHSEPYYWAGFVMVD